MAGQAVPLPRAALDGARRPRRGRHRRAQPREQPRARLRPAALRAQPRRDALDRRRALRRRPQPRRGDRARGARGGRAARQHRRHRRLRAVRLLGGPRRAGNGPSTDRAVVAATRRARDAGDIRIVYFHWGVELDTRPNRRQRALAGVALRNGATVVLGAHPHVLQPVERRSSRRLVAWSLGNFVFSPGSLVATRSAILELELDGRGVHAHRLLPVRIVGSRPVLR